MGLALASALAPPKLAVAQGVLELSLQEAAERASRQSAQVALAEGALREARAARAGAGILLPENPRLSIEGRMEMGQPSSLSKGYAASLEAPFELGGAPGARVVEAERRIASSEIDFAREQLSARYGAWSLYVELKLAARRMEAAEESKAIAQRVWAASAAQLDAGAVSAIDLAVAETGAAEAAAAREAAAADGEALRFEMLQLLGLPAGTELRLTSDLAPLPSCLEGVAADGDLRPEILAARAQIAELEATRRRLERELFPRVGAAAGVDGAPNSPTYGFLGLSIELPVVRRNQGPRAVAREAVENARQRLRLLEQRIDREVSSLRATCRARRAQAMLLEERSLPQAKAALELVEKGWRAGKYDVFRVSAAARDLSRLRGADLDAVGLAWRAQIALSRALMKGLP
jgi:cobalt-zinc-cadmium efflux system outer membrane protein